MARVTAANIDKALTVGEVAERSGVAVSALHFYERKGLIHSRRSAGNQRRYHRDVLRRVAVIKVAQRIGIPLAEVAEALASLPEARSPNARDWSRLSARWRQELDERITYSVGGAVASPMGGRIQFDEHGAPLNPEGRTGLRGRGLLGKWG